MPYIICVPGIFRPFLTNDPRIYIDCYELFKWDCEARPYSDALCKKLQEEDSRHESDSRRHQLENYWMKALRLNTKKESICSCIHSDTPTPGYLMHGVVIETREVETDDL
ncbi:hypothetical protein EJ02DRAFT_458051 [Clathrospora elynae]|uniref:Uncharacterized protein n=1 Tax=Clathrospora elynae TaxID=706981 RepID=A0A6A5SES1_9PLEO|nr:hypothetical protein EJ02DRAFT_458051 [Clathrospora elynae]